LQTLLQVCERIPTIATQLKILSTVKATMLGSQGRFKSRVTWGRCYDQNFLRFSTIFGEKIGVFLKKPML
jgi:hypothetical protein